MKIYYETHGTGEPLVLIPGFASGAWIWFRQIESLSKKFQVITFDPRGIGQSKVEGDKDLQNLSMRLFAEDVLQILDDLKIKKAHILGASFGGFVAQEFALEFPERLNKLVLACTSAGGANHVAPNAEVLAAFAPHPEMSVAERVCLFIRPAFTEEFVEKFSEEFDEVCQMRIKNDVADEVYTAQLKAAFAFDSENRLSKISNQALVLTGDKDIVVPMQNSLRLAEKIPNAKLEIIKNGSHLFFIEQAEKSNEIISRFIQS